MRDDNTAEARRELTRRVAGVARTLGTGPDPAAELDAIRRLAAAHGLASAATVAGLIALATRSAATRGFVAGWLPVLQDALADDGRDPAFGRACVAACGVRLAH